MHHHADEPPEHAGAPLTGKPLTDQEREEISLGYQRKYSARRIARRLGRRHTVITRELARPRKIYGYRTSAEVYANLSRKAGPDPRADGLTPWQR
jgi:IS30 family transposase